MATPYIPARDADYRTWLNNFAATVNADPTSYGLTSAEAAYIQSLADLYSDAYSIATNPSTRTPVTVQAKDSTRASTEASVRTFAFRIIANPSVPPAALIAAGLNPRNFTPSPIPAPSTQPLLNILRLAHLVSELGYADSTTPSHKKKPAGATALQLVGGAAATTTSPDNAPTIRMVTRTPFQIIWSSPGPVRLWGRWTTRRGLTGPWSDELAFNVP